jgi:CRISPR-associated endonuclease/helicase Cas3
MSSRQVPRRIVDDPLPQVLAKSAQHGRPPESLAYHLNATLHAAIEVQDRIGRLSLAEAVIGDEFWHAAILAALAHDAGKVADGFQRMLAGRGGWGHRHEVLSLGFLPWLVPDSPLLPWIATAVVTHHRPLTESPRSIQHAYAALDVEQLRVELGPVDPERVRGLATWLVGRAASAGLRTAATHDGGDAVAQAHRLLQGVFDQWQRWVDDRDVGLTAVLLQGAVTLADHLSSGHGSLHTTQPVGRSVPKQLRQQLGGALHPHQQEAEQAEGHLLLRAPTGSGKTEAGLLWAAARVAEIVRARGGCPRLFFTLPYLASINAMARRLEASLRGGRDHVGVSHSRAASYYLATSLMDEDADGDAAGDPRAAAARKAVARDNATRLFRETIRVGTPYQLLRGALAGAAHSGILIDSANSVFILDELHAYDARRLGYILATVRLWERLGGMVAVLSATLPNALVTLLCEALHGTVTQVQAAAAWQRPRHRVRTRQHHLTDPRACKEIRDRLAADQAVLVVANSVAHAQELYATLAPEAQLRHGDGAAALLHSRFKRKDRTTIEEHITARYGVGGGPRQPGLVVATQVVEVSLDVDFDILFTAAAPLEAMLQRFGRVNRLGGRPPADVVVHTPAYKARRGEDGEFADGVYPREPVDSGWQILCRHADEVVDETHAVGWLDEVYTTAWGEQWRQDVGRYRRDFETKFLGFEFPYSGRDELEERFDQMFEGTEAILAEDREHYREALTRPVRDDGKADRAAGRLLAEEYLIPLPYWSARLAGWDRQLKVAVVNGEYDPERGLVAVHGPERAASAYRPGEVL